MFETTLGLFSEELGIVQEVFNIGQSRAYGKTVFGVKGDKGTFAIKLGLGKIPLSRQLENRKKLEEFFNCTMPKIYRVVQTSGPPEIEVMLMEYVSGINLHKTVMFGLMPDKLLLKHWQDILETFKSAWEKSVKVTTERNDWSRDPITRLEKIRDYVYTLVIDNNLYVKDIADRPIILNGIIFPSMSQFFSDLQKSYCYPKVSVFCHNDANGDNFLVTEEKWKLVDFEWCSWTDHRLSQSHLIGWWLADTISLKANPLIRNQEDRIHIEYEISIPDLAKKIAEMSYQSAVDFVLNKEDTNHMGLKALLATFFLGETRFVLDKEKVFDFTVVLIGEALKVFYQKGNPLLALD